MKCYYCGTEVSEKEVFCRYCGTRQIKAQAESAAEPMKEEDRVQSSVDRIFNSVSYPELETDDMAWHPYELPKAADGNEAPLPAPAAPVSRPAAPRLQLPTGRSLVKMIFLGILTLGIYPTVIWSRIVTELNLSASRYDGERTMPYFAMLILTPVTLGILPLVWFHNFSRRVGNELTRRGIGYQFGAKTFWLWDVLGALILVGPFVYLHKLMKAMNYINADFNKRG